MIFIVTAYRIEAEPFFNYFDFADDESAADYQIFRSDQAILGISGEGKRNAAELTELFISKHVKIEDRGRYTWLNFGIAGSGSHRYGSLVMANEVIDDTSGTRWPLPDWNLGVVSPATVKTVAKPANDYRKDLVYDMESSGMMSVLSTHSIEQSALVVKLISDAPKYPYHRLTKSDIVQLLKSVEGELHALIQRFEYAVKTAN